MIRAALAAACFFALVAAAQPASAQSTAAPADNSGRPRIETLGDIAPALGKCWTPPVMDGVGQITVLLSFKRDGSINGLPRITYTRAVDPEDKRALKESLLAALAACGPLPVSASLGAAIAGRPFAIRFFVVDKKGEHDI